MAEYIEREKALTLDFRINVDLFESRRKTAERAVQAYADAISAIPAADVRPVVLGKWQPLNSLTNKCTNCGEKFWFYLGVPFNFCPNCGCTMEKS